MDDKLRTFIKIIGCIVFVAILYALPILLTLSFAFSWIQPIKFLLVITNLCIFAAICGTIYVEVDD